MPFEGGMLEECITSVPNLEQGTVILYLLEMCYFRPSMNEEKDRREERKKEKHHSYDKLPKSNQVFLA